jgi:hypothetical protein
MFDRLGRCHFASWCSTKTFETRAHKEPFLTYTWLFYDRIFFHIFPMCILGPTECLHRYGMVTIPTSTDLIECLLQSQLKQHQLHSITFPHTLSLHLFSSLLSSPLFPQDKPPLSALSVPRNNQSPLRPSPRQQVTLPSVPRPSPSQRVTCRSKQPVSSPSFTQTTGDFTVCPSSLT